jgi:glutamine synthetase
MVVRTKRDVLKMVKERNVSFIQIWFTDILGMLKGFSITPSELEGALTEGMGFDGSSIEGFARIEESDMVAMPDPMTFQFLPWQPNDRPVARMFCDILQPDGSHYEGDPRYVFKRVLQKAADKGYKFYIGPELEYFYFETMERPKIIDR